MHDPRLASLHRMRVGLGIALVGGTVLACGAVGPRAPQAAAVVVVGAADGGGAQGERTPWKPLAVTEVERAADATHASVSYPAFKHPHPKVASELNARVHALVRDQDGLVGSSTCETKLASEGMVSVLCQSLVEAAHDPERDALAARGMGGAPGGPTIMGLTLLVDGDRVTELAFEELFVAPAAATTRLRALCHERAVADHDAAFEACPTLCDEIGPPLFAVVPDALQLYVDQRPACVFQLGFDEGKALLALGGPLGRAATGAADP